MGILICFWPIVFFNDPQRPWRESKPRTGLCRPVAVSVDHRVKPVNFIWRKAEPKHGGSVRVNNNNSGGDEVPYRSRTKVKLAQNSLSNPKTICLAPEYAKMIYKWITVQALVSVMRKMFVEKAVIKFKLWTVLLLLSLPRLSKGAEDLVIADFEGQSYQGWVSTGTAFGDGPVTGGFTNQQPVTGFLGHGFVDSYLNGDLAIGTLTSPEFTIDRPFISFLIGGGNHPGTACINLMVDDKTIATATGLNDEHLDWFTWDVKAFKGRKAKIQIIDSETGNWGHINVDQIIQTDRPPVPALGLQSPYHESLRPQFHFTSRTNWINDPNGLVFFAGEYHLFFQHNPFGNNWGNMTWGHAVSPDLLHWTQLDDTLKPDELGTMFSGSAVVDWNNTSGFGENAKPPLVAMYTAAGGTSPESKNKRFSQCIAFSNDQGRTWTKYRNNPVIPTIDGENRDPKVIWYEPTKSWICALYKSGSVFTLFSSKDLKQWKLLQELTLPGCSECPDFFPLALDGNPSQTRWIFTAANGKYVVGEFDGQHFTTHGDLRQVDFGRNFYAMQTYSDLPAKDGRRIQIGWMRDGRYPRMPFNGQMSFPVELTLRSTPDGPRMYRSPVKEIALLHRTEQTWNDVPIIDGGNLLANVRGDLFHIQAEIDPGTATSVGFKIRGQTVIYSTASHLLQALGQAPVELEKGHLLLEILVDRSSIETFADHGRVSFSSCYLPADIEHPLDLVVQGGNSRVIKLSVFPLASVWSATKPAGSKPAPSQEGG